MNGEQLNKAIKDFLDKTQAGAWIERPRHAEFFYEEKPSQYYDTHSKTETIRVSICNVIDCEQCKVQK